MKNIIIAILAIAVAGVLSACETAQNPPKHKVVYHINYKGGEKGAAYMAAMGNIQNHINAVGADKIDLKVVMHGDGLEILKDAKTDPKIQDRVKGLKAQQVDFAVCKNTLVGRKIDYKKDLFDVSEGDIVPSGVAELAILQSKGYAYIKP
ncbi:MAG: hypothetical protein FJX42_01045 [Alphaproteobacteria bacterium]|nr:hypothetical protein [Alphaproteobacteria bacterium]